MNEATIVISNIDGSARDFTVSSKELKDMIIPDNGQPFSFSLALKDSKGIEVTISFGTDGGCTIWQAD